MKSRLLVLGIILIIVLGGLYIWKYQPQLLGSLNIPQLPNAEINNLTQQVTEKLQPALEETEPIVSSLTTEGEKVASRAAAVLGSTIGVPESASQPATLIEGTAQYARYWYCKQVVDQYELQYQNK